MINEVKSTWKAAAILCRNLQCRYLLIVIEAEKYGVMDTNGVIRLNHNVINTALEMLKVTISSRATHAGVHHVEWDTLRKAVKVGIKN